MAESRLEASPKINSEASFDVIAAQATPPGESAIGMLRLSGSGALRVAQKVIRWPSRGPVPREAVLAKAFDGNRLLDRVVATYFPAPGSYTGEEFLEICAHGSRYILSRLLELLIESGARMAGPGEFTQRAFLHGKLDLAQAEAVCRLISSDTAHAHRAALDQLEGGISSKIRFLRGEILEALAFAEAELDHPDDDLPTADAVQIKRKLADIRASISALIQSHRLGRLRVDGARVAILGRPNVGKSSLLNALLGRERAIVSETPGTTRDTLEEATDLEGLKTFFIDTAGLRDHTTDSIEQAGMVRARQALESCHLALLVTDRSKPMEKDDLRLLQEISALCQTQKKPMVVAMNKSDLPSGVPHPALPAVPVVLVSARAGTGLDELISTISSFLIPRNSMEQSGTVASLRHLRALESADRALSEAAHSFPQGEISALHLRESLHALGLIVGESTTEDLLKTIFSNFCVGK